MTAWLDLEPKNGQARVKLAQALFHLDKPDDAFIDLQQAVRDDDKLDPPTVIMARFWASKSGDAKKDPDGAKKSHDKAREWFEKALKAEPKNIKVQLAYADWLVGQGEVDKAQKMAEEAVNAKKDDHEVLRLRGLIARVQGDLGLAETIFRRIQNEAPGDVNAANQLALVLADQSDSSQRSRAVQLARVNAAQYGQSPEVVATLGYCLYRVGAVDRSLAGTPEGGSRRATVGRYGLLHGPVPERQGQLRGGKKFLKGALETTGLFVYRKEAQMLHDKLAAKKEPPKAPGK